MNTKKFREFQYLVRPPLFLITSAILSGIDHTNFSHYSGVIHSPMLMKFFYETVLSPGEHLHDFPLRN